MALTGEKDMRIDKLTSHFQLFGPPTGLIHLLSEFQSENKINNVVQPCLFIHNETTTQLFSKDYFTFALGDHVAGVLSRFAKGEQILRKSLFSADRVLQI